MKGKIILFWVLWAVSYLSFAQQVLLKGSVSDAEKKPVAGVSIKILGSKKGVLTDSTGKFACSSLHAGDYTLQASYVGYKTLNQKIILQENKTLELNLEMVETSTDLKEIVVVGYFSQNEKPVTVGKLPIRPLDLPQAVFTLDKSLLDAQQVSSMSDVLMNTNGVYIMGTTGGYQEEISARGFAMGSSNTFKNGMRYANGMMSEMSGIERIEVLKGSTAILYGNVAAGGIINLVTKKPKFGFGGEISLKSGSWNLFKPSIDIYGGLSNKIAGRLNASTQTVESFREGVSSKRFYVNPSLLFKFNEKTSLLVEGDYFKSNQTPDFGAGIINYSIVNVPRTRFLGVPWSYISNEQSSVNLSLSHQFSSNWNLKFATGLRKNNTELFSNTRPNTGTAISSAGMWIRNLQKSASNETYGLAQIDLVGNLEQGALKHQLLIGADADFYQTQTLAYNQYAKYDTVNVFLTTQYRVRNDVPTMTLATTTNNPVNRFGIYAQDLLHFGAQWKILAGLRYSYQQTISEVITQSTGQTVLSSNFDGAFSPRLGVVYQPSTQNAIFASYSNSFALNTGVDLSNKALPPSVIDQYEVGSKNELFHGLLSANVTAYRIFTSNLAQTSLANGNTYTYIKELAGSVQSQGVEVDLASKPISGFVVTAGYSYNQTNYVKSNTYIEGSLLRYNPAHTGNLGLRYSKNNFQVGLVSAYIGKRFAGRSTRIQVANDAYQLIELPEYVQMDVTLGYTYKNILLKGKIGNVGDVLSYNVHDDNSVNPIAPRNFSLNLIYLLK